MHIKALKHYWLLLIKRKTLLIKCTLVPLNILPIVIKRHQVSTSTMILYDASWLNDSMFYAKQQAMSVFYSFSNFLQNTEENLLLC